MANQIIIDIGAVANDGTGDPLRTAFNYVNDNFSNVWNTGLPSSNVQFSGNRILTVNTNGNLILAPNGIGKVVSNVDIIPVANRVQSLGSPTLRWNTVYTQYANIITANISSATINDVNLGNVGTLEIGVDNLHVTGGTNGYVLQTDGEGNLTWTAQTGGGGNGVPGGANTQVQFNDAGSFGGHAGFTFNKNTHLLTLPGSITLSSTPSGPSNTIQYGTGNLVVWNDGGWTIGEYNGNTWGTEGIRISPGIEGNTNIDLPSDLDAATRPLAVDNYAGSVRMYAGNGNVNIQTSDTHTTYNWAFNSLGSIEMPANSASYTLGRIQSANGYPTLLGYGSGSHGGPELDWMNGNDPQDMGNINIIRNTLYLNDEGLYIGMNENGNANPGFSGHWTFDNTGNFTTPGTGGDITMTGGRITGVANILPDTSNTYSLGNSTLQWKDLWVSNATIYLNSNPLTVTAGNILTFDGNAVITNNSNTANIGNFVFNGNSLQNINGGNYNNGDLTHGATSGLGLAPNGSGTSTLYNNYGDLSLETRRNSDILFNTQRIAASTDNWVDTYGELTDDANNTVGESCVMDSGGNVYVTGSCYNPDLTVDVGFLRKLSPVGVVLWEVAAPDPSTFTNTVSTAGEIVWESGGTVWWLINCWGPHSHWAVMKLNGSNGGQYWTTEIVGAGYAGDMTVSSTGVCYVAGAGADGGDTVAQITALDVNGNNTWSKQPGITGMSIIARSDGVIMVGGQNGAVWGYDTSGNALWTKFLFNGGDSIWGLAWDGAAWYAAGRETGLVAKVNGSDNDTIMWQKLITVQFSSWSTTWMEYSSYDGHLYITGMNQDQFGNRGFATVAMAANTGALVWANSLVANSPGQWWNWGHHDLTVYHGYYAVTGNANPNRSAHERQILAKLPTDGSLTGETVGAFQYVSMTNIAVVTDTAPSDFDPAPGNANCSRTENNYDVDPATIPVLQNLLNYFQTEYQWSFDHFGNLVTGGSITNGNIYAGLNLYSVTDIRMESGPGIIAGADGNQINFDAGNGNIDGGDTAGRGGAVNINSGAGGDATTGGAGAGGWIELNAGYGGLANTTNNIQAGAGGSILLVAGAGGNSLGNSALTNSGGNVELYGGMGSWDVETPAAKAGHVHLYGGNWGWISPSGNVYIHTNPTGLGGQEKNWEFNNQGQTLFPYLSTARGDTNSGVIQGYTLSMGDGALEAIITTPDGKAGAGPASQRLVINPGKGQDGTSGEGGDIYLWAGRGGTGDLANAVTGGSGGDIKIRGGQGMATNAGGYIRMEAGDSNNDTGDAGYIQITAGQTNGGNPGYVNITGGQNLGSTPGGNVQITGGQGSAAAGNVNLVGGQGVTQAGNINITGAQTQVFTSIKAGNVNISGGYGNFGDGGGGPGGDVNITGGDSSDAIGGNVNIAGGSQPGGNNGVINLNNKTFLPVNYTGPGPGEAAWVNGTRTSVGGLDKATSAAASLSGAGVETVVYTATGPDVQSIRFTFAVQSGGAAFNWEQFDVVAIKKSDGTVATIVSNRARYNDTIDYTVVTAGSVFPGVITISLALPTGQTIGYVNYTAVEFNLMVD